MSYNSIRLLYRCIYKDVRINPKLYRDTIQTEIHKYDNINSDMLSEKVNKLSEWERFIDNYIKMKKHIVQENQLLESYNINVPRDSKRTIEAVAKRVGFEL